MITWKLFKIQTSELICKYIAGRVLSNNATFDMRLHTIYLINDVFHHAHKRDSHLIHEAFEGIIVPLFPSRFGFRPRRPSHLWALSLKQWLQGGIESCRVTHCIVRVITPLISLFNYITIYYNKKQKNIKTINAYQVVRYYSINVPKSMLFNDEG